MRIRTTVFCIGYLFYMNVSPSELHRAASLSQNNYANPYDMIKEGQSLLKDGDLVVRLNRDPVSAYIKNANRRDKSYSHGGIVLFEGGQPYVYHILNENPGENFRRDSMAIFCDPRKNMAYGIFRYQFSSQEIGRLHDIIREWRRKGIGFDYSLDLGSDDKMYCSEMISKVLARATDKRICIQTDTLSPAEARMFAAFTHKANSSAGKIAFVPIDALYTNPQCRPVKRFDYEKSF